MKPWNLKPETCNPPQLAYLWRRFINCL